MAIGAPSQLTRTQAKLSSMGVALDQAAQVPLARWQTPTDAAKLHNTMRNLQQQQQAAGLDHIHDDERCMRHEEPPLRGKHCNLPEHTCTHTHDSQCAKNRLSLLIFVTLNQAEVTLSTMHVEKIRTTVICSSPSCMPATMKSDSHVNVDDDMAGHQQADYLLLLKDQARSNSTADRCMRRAKEVVREERASKRDPVSPVCRILARPVRKKCRQQNASSNILALRVRVKIRRPDPERRAEKGSPD